MRNESLFAITSSTLSSDAKILLLGLYLSPRTAFQAPDLQAMAGRGRRVTRGSIRELMGEGLLTFKTNLKTRGAIGKKYRLDRRKLTRWIDVSLEKHPYPKVALTAEKGVTPRDRNRSRGHAGPNQGQDLLNEEKDPVYGNDANASNKPWLQPKKDGSRATTSGHAVTREKWVAPIGGLRMGVKTEEHKIHKHPRDDVSHPSGEGVQGEGGSEALARAGKKARAKNKPKPRAADDPDNERVRQVYQLWEKLYRDYQGRPYVCVDAKKEFSMLYRICRMKEVGPLEVERRMRNLFLGDAEAFPSRAWMEEHSACNLGTFLSQGVFARLAQPTQKPQKRPPRQVAFRTREERMNDMREAE